MVSDLFDSWLNQILPEDFDEFRSDIPWDTVPDEIFAVMRGIDAVKNIFTHAKKGELSKVFFHHQIFKLSPIVGQLI